jgi:hypothetical protein
LIAQIAILTFDDSNELDSFIAFCLLNWLGVPRMFDGSTYASERDSAAPDRLHPCTWLGRPAIPAPPLELELELELELLI